MHDVGSSVACNYFLGQIVARTARPAVYAHVHILADHVTLSRPQQINFMFLGQNQSWDWVGR